MDVLSNIEFYTFNDEAWVHFGDGRAEKLTENHGDIISAIYEMIEQFYPAAFTALCKEYERCIPNMSFYRYRIAVRFIKCNFGVIDRTSDIDAAGRIHLECVPCPLRGECKLENVVFGYIVMVTMTYVLDMVLDGNKQSYQILVFSQKNKEIGDAITNEVGRGATLLDAEGCYSHQDIKVLIVMVHKTDKPHVMQIIHRIDGNAFISVSKAQGVYGKNFEKLKL